MKFQKEDELKEYAKGLLYQIIPNYTYLLGKKVIEFQAIILQEVVGMVEENQLMVMVVVLHQSKIF